LQDELNAELEELEQEEMDKEVIVATFASPVAVSSRTHASLPCLPCLVSRFLTLFSQLTEVSVGDLELDETAMPAAPKGLCRCLVPSLTHVDVGKPILMPAPAQAEDEEDRQLQELMESMQ